MIGTGWEKLGCFYVPESNGTWRVTHAQLPIVDALPDKVLRVYFGTRNAANRTSTDCVDVDADDPTRILRVPERPLLSPGELGTFDDDGVLPSWVVRHGDVKYLYYIGWNAGVTVSYRNSIGLAVSEDDGLASSRQWGETSPGDSTQGSGSVARPVCDEPLGCVAETGRVVLSPLVGKIGWTSL